jgi:hypothetical protein
MAIGQSRLHELFRRGRRISDVAAWLFTFNSMQIQNEILDWIREDQLMDKGVNASNEVIGLYSAFTESLDSSKVAGTPYTLNDTGEFYRSMFIMILPNAIEIDADPIKVNDNLFDKYGNNIIGLTPESLMKLRLLTKKRYIEYIKEILLRP